VPVHQEPSKGANAVSTRATPELVVTPPDILDLVPALPPELRLLTGLLTAAVIIAGLYFGRDIVVPLALALLLAFVLEPLVGGLRRLGLARAPAVIVVVLTTMMLVGFAGVMLGMQVSSLSAQLPTYQNNIEQKLKGLRNSSDKPGMFDGAIRMFNTVRAEVDRASPTNNAKPSERLAAPLVQHVQIVDKAAGPFEQGLSWLIAAGKPLATVGIVFVFVVLVLLDRVDLRDRLLRLWGGSLHRSTDALDEAGQRISRYLSMQLGVNLTYGVPMAAGLWLIGVPGAILWGTVAALLRFVPYIGPMISSIFPLVLAFAVDPGWSMLLWALALIAALEMLVNNLVEPWLYGASTGLSALSLMVAATFWTALWGPIGLIMSTPLTVCLLVIGRHLPRLKFLHVLLGSQPALDTPTRIYQRLLSGDVDEAMELAGEQVDAADVVAFYNDVGIPVLRMAAGDHASVATAQHRHRVVAGMDALIEDLREQAPTQSADGGLSAVCIGGKWEVDTLAANMLAHALSVSGQPADFRMARTLNSEFISGLQLDGVRAVCVSIFSPEPRMQAKQFCRRLRRRWADVKIVLVLWNAPPELLGEEARKSLEADAVVTTLTEAMLHVTARTGIEAEAGYMEAPIPGEDDLRTRALRASGALDPRARLVLDAISRRAAEIFDVELAIVAAIDETEQTVSGCFGFLRSSDAPTGARINGDDFNVSRLLSMGGHVVANARTLVVPDVAKDLRFANNPTLKGRVRFYAGAPMRDQGGQVIGTLCLLDSEPVVLSERDLKLLEALAADTMQALRTSVATWSDTPSPVDEPDEASSATVGQVLPSGG
jgi:predicted PurR-regulated permease PerM